MLLERQCATQSSPSLHVGYQPWGRRTTHAPWSTHVLQPPGPAACTRSSRLAAAACTDPAYAPTPHHLQVAGRAGRDLGVAEDDLLGGAPAERADDARKDLLLADQRGVLARDEPSQAARLAARDQRDLRPPRAAQGPPRAASCAGWTSSTQPPKSVSCGSLDRALV